MVDEGELDSFRRRWNKELKSSQQTEHDVNVPESSTSRSETTFHLNEQSDRKDHSQTSPSTDETFEAISKFESHLNVDAQDQDGVAQKPANIDQGAQNQKEQSKPFLSSLFGGNNIGNLQIFPDCVENVVREEFIQTRNKRLKLSSSSSHVKVSTNNSLLDIFLSDLDEINEIPFFESTLPKELAIKIFYHLEPLELCRCSQVSKAWQSLAEDELLWSQICSQLGYEETAKTIEKTNWKEIVKEHVLRERLLRNNWKTRNGTVSPLEYVSGGILCAASSWNHTIAAGYSNGKVCVWDEDGDFTLEPSSTALVIDETAASGTLTNSVRHICVNQHFVAATYSQGIVDVWRLRDKQRRPVNTLNCRKSLGILTCSTQDSLLAAAAGNLIWTYNYQENEHGGNFMNIEMDSQVSNICILSSGKHRNRSQLAISMFDRVKIHQVGQTVEEMRTIHDTLGHHVTCIDGTAQELAVGIHGDDVFVVKLYDVSTAREMVTLLGHSWLVSVVNLVDSPPHSIVTGSYDRKVRVYDTRLDESIITLCGHTGMVQCVQMDDWKVVSGGVDGMVIVWDQRMATKLWEQHNRHPVKYMSFKDNMMYTANIPGNKHPETDDFDTVYHRRYRGNLCMYNFALDQTRHPALPSNVMSTYDEPEGYSYNIGLAVPYDRM